MPSLLYTFIGIYMGLSVIYIGYTIRLIFKYKKERNKYIEEWKSHASKELEGSYAARKQVLDEVIVQAQNTLTSLGKEIESKQNFNSSLLKIREEELERLMTEKKARAMSEVKNEIDDWAQSAQEAAEFQRDQILNQYQNEIDSTYEKLRDLYCEVNEYKDIQKAINEEILRRRAVEEQQAFYCVQIPDSYKHDLALLDEIRHDFSKIDLLDKLIYDNYIKKPVDEMIQRVLNGRAPSGIYKITRLKTGEIYIGKSTDIKVRFQQHCKSCYHCGTISRSKLHNVMENDGIWNFTFELLEEVPKEKLTEREKYWINFYDSKKFGLNEREG